MAKKDFTADAASVFVDAMVTPTEQKTEQPKQATPKPQPKAKASSAPAEPQNAVKVTFMLNTALYDKLRYITYKERTHIRAILTEALTDYMAKYERKNGRITAEQ